MKYKHYYGSEGNIEPGGRDFWSHNLLGEFLIVICLPILIIGSIVAVLYLLIT